MTGKEILKIALDLLYDDTDEYNTYAVSLLNTMIPELYGVENSIRRTEGKDLLTDIPYVKTLSEVIPYHDNLTIGAMPYGLAAKIVLDDNDMARVGYFQQLYVNAVNSYTKVTPEPVVNVYE